MDEPKRRSNHSNHEVFNHNVSMTQDKTQLGYVRTEQRGGVRTVEFHHPSHNSLPGRLLRELRDAIDAAGADDTVRVVVLRSGGERTFCAGASFDELKSIRNAAEGEAFFLGFANVINAMRRCPKFIIGRVQGKAVGGGVGLASAVDYCFATRYASVKLSELAIGIGPFVIAPAVERKVGLSKMSQMGINATAWYTAEWAQTAGLYAAVSETTEGMDARIDELVQQLDGCHVAAMRDLKRVFWQNTDHWDDLLAERARTSGTLILSDFCRNYLAAL